MLEGGEMTKFLDSAELISDLRARAAAWRRNVATWDREREPYIVMTRRSLGVVRYV